MIENIVIEKIINDFLKVLQQKTCLLIVLMSLMLLFHRYEVNSYSNKQMVEYYDVDNDL